MYVSDRPGKHNMELLKRMVLPNGNVLLCTQPGRPTLDCLFADCMRDKQTLLKVSIMLFAIFVYQLMLLACISWKGEYHVALISAEFL